MSIKVKVIPNAKRVEIKKENDKYKVYLTAPAVEDKANKMLVKVLAEHFGVKKSQVRIIRGEKARDKVVQVTSS